MDFIPDNPAEKQQSGFTPDVPEVSQQTGPPQKTLFGQTVAPGTITQYTPSPTEGILTGAGLLGLPAAIRSIPSMGRSIAGFFRHPAGREEVMQNVLKGVGGKGSSAAQALETTPEIRAAYDLANQSGNVSSQPILKSLDQAYQKIATYDPKTAQYLKDRIMTPYVSGNDALYEQVINDSQEINRLATASKDPIVATALRNARNGMIDAMDTVSPAARQANQLVRHNTAIQDITGIMRNRGPKAGLAMRQMLEQEEGTRNVLGLTNPQRYNQFVQEVDQVAATSLTPESKAERLVGWLRNHPYVPLGAIGLGAYGHYMSRR